MRANSNRGLVVTICIIAGVLIGLFAGIYIYYAWAPPEMVLRDASPRFLYHDSVRNTPQYRDLYVVRVANKYASLVNSDAPGAMQSVYDSLGVTVGDASFEDAVRMVTDAEVAARTENNIDGDGGRFSRNDELFMKSLRDALNSVPPESRPKPDITLNAPAIARNNARLVGLILLVLWTVLLGFLVYAIDHWFGPRLKPIAWLRRGHAVVPQASVWEPVAQAVAPVASAPGTVAATTPGVTPVAPTSPARVTPLPSDVPLATFAPTIYKHGDEHFDEDFAINGPMGELVGECGASIADRIGVETPARVAAISLWVFDKNDFQSTTKVLLTDFAWNDPVIRTKLKARGDAVQAVEGGVIEILTSTLRVLIQVSDVAFNADNNPPNGYFESVTLTFNVYTRQPAAV